MAGDALQPRRHFGRAPLPRLKGGQVIIEVVVEPGMQDEGRVQLRVDDRGTGREGEQNAHA